jgi:hypothetical protein
LILLKDFRLIQAINALKCIHCADGSVVHDT